MPRFGKDKEQGRNEDLDRQAQEEIERLTRRGGAPGMGGGPGGMGGMGGPGGPGAGPPIGIPSPLERMAAELQERPPARMRRLEGRERTAPRQQQVFTPMPTGGVGSSFGPGGLNPGPRGGGGMTAPPPSFGGGGPDDDFGGPVSGPPVFNAEPDEDEEMSITEMALMDHAARTGHNPEDLVMRYDASTAEEMRDRAMRQFYERQQSRPAGGGTNNPFAPAGMRSGPAGPATVRRNQDPRAAGGALAERLANRRRRDDAVEERQAPAAPAAPSAAAAFDPSSRPPRSSRSAAPAPAPADEEGAVAKLLARRRRALGIDDTGEEVAEPEPVAEPAADVPGPRHAAAREEASPGLRAAPLGPADDEVDDDEVDDDEVDAAPEEAADEPPAPPARRPRKAAATAKATTAKAAKAAKAPAPKKAPARKAPAKAAGPAAKAAKAATAKAATATKTVAKAKKGGATLATAEVPVTNAPAKAPAKAPARKATKAKTVFCIECGEKNPAIAKFCFNCGTRLAAPEG